MSVTSPGEQVVDLEALDFSPSEALPGARSARVPFDPCEAKVMYYPAGITIPRHHHTGDTLKVILQGRIDRPEGALTPGVLHACGGSEYGPWVVAEDTYLLLLQAPGTTGA
jgi:anti-sigma factor ChrR (cupin superfamily)